MTAPVISWHLVFNTHTESTALKLVGRVRRRLDAAMHNVWLRRWGEDGSLYAATFQTACPPGETVVGSAFELARRLATTWTIRLPETAEEVLLEAWIPRDYRRSMDGLLEASLTVFATLQTGEQHGSARCVTLADLTIHVVRGSTAS